VHASNVFVEFESMIEVATSKWILNINHKNDDGKEFSISIF
jgi:hypothetical protein